MRRTALATLALLLPAGALAAAETVDIPVAAAVVLPAKDGRHVLAVHLTKDGEAAFAEFTARHQGEVVELRIDDELITAPRIHSPIVAETLPLSGDRSEAEWRSLADRLTQGTARLTVGPETP